MIKFIDKFEPSETSVVLKSFDMLDIKPGENHIELGSGDGRFVVEALSRGAHSVGYESDESLVSTQDNVIVDDVFNVDVSDADVITCWFTKLPESKELMDKLATEMKDGARLLKIGKTDHYWQPKESVYLDGNWINLYVKESSWLLQ